MDYRNYYLHGTAGMRGAYSALNRIEQVLKEGKISVSKSYENIDRKYIQHGPRIYLCDFSKPSINGLESSYSLFIARGPSLVLEKNIAVITPAYSSTYEGQEQEWTNLYDEVRTGEDVSLTKLVAVILPLELLLQQYQVELFLQSRMDQIHYSSISVLKNVIRPALERLNFIKKAYEAVKDFDSNLPVIDNLTQIPITEEVLFSVEDFIQKGECPSKTYFLKNLVSYKK